MYFQKATNLYTRLLFSTTTNNFISAQGCCSVEQPSYFRLSNSSHIWLGKKRHVLLTVQLTKPNENQKVAFGLDVCAEWSKCGYRLLKLTKKLKSRDT